MNRHGLTVAGLAAAILIGDALVGSPAMAQTFNSSGVVSYPCSRTVASAASRDATTLTVVNHGSTPIKVYWIDFDGDREREISLAARGGTLRQQGTYRRHVWEIADDSSDCLRYFKLGTTGDGSVHIYD